MTDRIREGREESGLSMKQAAKLLGVDLGELFGAETGTAKPSDELLIKMARLYQTTVAWLLGDEPQISDANKALLRAVEHTGDRAELERFMGMLSTPERPGYPEPPKAKTLARVATERIDRAVTDVAVDSTPIATKRRYVQRQGQTRKHHCHWPGCETQVPPAMWGCKAHWFKLPKALRDRIWRAYAPGQEVDMTPSEEYLQVANDVQRWIMERGEP